jgi:chemotaxis protein methyltransferase CheR
MNEFDPTEFKALLESIRLIYGYDFTEYSEASVKRRVANFMKNHGLHELDQLGKVLLKDEAIFEQFIQEISVTVTEMFRDPSFYRSLREKVIKRLATYPFIKIWVAGCATGEEAYSLAIVLKEEDLLHRSIIYATDINQKSLQIGKEGIYPLANMQGYKESYEKAGGKAESEQYYKAKYKFVLIHKSLKNHIVFSAHNLTTDQSFNEFQLVICRNVLIYFNKTLQDKVINLFHESLCTFGFLGLGNKESLRFTSKGKCFEDVVAKEKIFMKTQ